MARFRVKYRLWRLAVAVVVLSVIVLTRLYYATSIWNETVKISDERVVDLAVFQFENRLDEYVGLLYGARALATEHETITALDWQEMFISSSIIDRLAGLSALGYTVYLDQSEVPAFEQKMRSDVTLSPADYQQFTVNPLTESPSVLSLAFVQPYSSPALRRAIGFNLLSDPVRKAAFEKARDLNTHTVAVPVQGVSTGVPVFVIVLPYYKDDLPIKTLVERREAVKGAVIIGFRTEDFFYDALEPVLKKGDMTVEIFTGTDTTENALLFTGGKEAAPKVEPNYVFLRTVQVADQTWTLRFSVYKSAGTLGASLPWRINLYMFTTTAAIVAVVLWAVQPERCEVKND